MTKQQKAILALYLETALRKSLCMQAEWNSVKKGIVSRKNAHRSTISGISFPSYLQRLWKSLNLRSLWEWFSHGGQNSCPPCFGSCWNVYSVYAAGALRVWKYFVLMTWWKWCLSNCDLQELMTRSRLYFLQCALQSHSQQVWEICHCVLWLPPGPHAQCYGFFSPTICGIHFLSQDHSWLK